MLKSGVELYFILGWDSLTQLPRWHQAKRLVKLCRLAAVPRPGYGRPDLKALETEIPGISGRVTMLDIPEVDISATEIRQRIAAGLPAADLVPPPVEEYISRSTGCISRGSALQTSAPTWFRSLTRGPFRVLPQKDVGIFGWGRRVLAGNGEDSYVGPSSRWGERRP